MKQKSNDGNQCCSDTMCSNMELTVDATKVVAVVLQLAVEVTKRALLRLAADETEYAEKRLAVETTGCDVLKLAIDAIQ